MRRTQLQRAAGRAAVVLGVLGGGWQLGAGGSGAAGGAPAPQLPAAAHRPVTAVVSLAGAAPVGAPGVSVVATLPRVGAEVVRGTPAALAALRSDAGVAGLHTDGPVRTLSVAARVPGRTAAPTYAWQRLGEPAGRAGAGRGVTVAVVDSGISDTPALNRASGRLVDGVDTSGLAAAGRDRPRGAVRTTGTFGDGFGHGTFLANLVAGGPAGPAARVAGRGIGVAPGARVVAVKVADDAGRTSLAAVLAGLDWVASHRPVDVVALALAADRPGAGYGADPLIMAVRHLDRAGLPVVVAAGNTPGEVGDPGFAPQALTVGAADLTAPAARMAPFSGSAVVAGVRKPDLVAAGLHLRSLVPAGSRVAREFPAARLPSGLWLGSGTSQATAVAAGAVALYLSGHPDTAPAGVRAALRGAAAPMADARAGSGLLRLPDGGGRPDPGVGVLDRRAWWRAAWGGDRWWSAKSWSAKSWSAKSWSAKSWSAKSWSAKSWSAKSWSAKSWSAAR